MGEISEGTECRRPGFRRLISSRFCSTMVALDPSSCLTESSEVSCFNWFCFICETTSGERADVCLDSCGVGDSLLEPKDLKLAVSGTDSKSGEEITSPVLAEPERPSRSSCCFLHRFFATLVYLMSGLCITAPSEMTFTFWRMSDEGGRLCRKAAECFFV